MAITQRITPCFWFANQAEEAAQFYTSIFKNSKITNTTYYSDAGQEIHGQPPGSVLTVEFELEGQAFTGLNGGSQPFKFNESISFQINCETQEEIDYYWDKLTPGGDESAQQCGWLKDKFGLSWQVAPTAMAEMLKDPESEGAKRAMNAMMKMKKIDVDELWRAYSGETVA